MMVRFFFLGVRLGAFGMMLMLMLMFRFDRDFRSILCAAGGRRGRKQGQASGERRFRLLNRSSLRPRGRLVLKAHDIGARRFKFYGHGLVFDGDVQPAMSMHMRAKLSVLLRRGGKSDAGDDARENECVLLQAHRDCLRRFAVVYHLGATMVWR